LIALSALSAGTAAPVLPARTAGLTLVNLITPPTPTRAVARAPSPAKMHAVTDRVTGAALRRDAQRLVIPPTTAMASATPLGQSAEDNSPPPPAPVAAAPAHREQSAYTALLWQRIATHRPAGIELAGSALVEFRLDRTGHLVSARITQSSGIVLLDRLALRAVKDAAPFPPPPADLAEADLAFAVPVNFR
jgi:protein TonB